LPKGLANSCLLDSTALVCDSRQGVKGGIAERRNSNKFPGDVAAPLPETTF
jgi:hypothetical protein